MRLCVPFIRNHLNYTSSLSKFRVNRTRIIERRSVRKQPTFHDVTFGFPAKWRLRNERGNSILMTGHYPELGGAFDWSCRVGNLLDEVSEQIFSQSKIPLASCQRNLDLNHPDVLWISFACAQGFETSYLLLFNKWKSRSLQVELEFIIKDKVLLSFSWTQKWPVGFKHIKDASNHSSAILKIPVTSGLRAQSSF